MDIYSFIHSADVAAYCREIGKTWNTCEMARIIDRGTCSKEEKFKAWQELIDNYPDMPAPIMYEVTFGSIHEILKKAMNGNIHINNINDSCQYIDIPIPFKRGDIISKGNNLMVYDRLDIGNGAGKISRAIGWCFIGKRIAILLKACFEDYYNYEYYKGKLEGKNRLLHYVSLYLKNEIDIECLLNMQCRIVLEHILEINFDLDSRSCRMSDALLAEKLGIPVDKKAINEKKRSFKHAGGDTGSIQNAAKEIQ